MRHTAPINNRAFIVSLTSRFVDSSLNQRDLTCARLLSFGDAAIAQRQGARLLEVGQALSSLPLPESIRAIGAYYTGIATANRQQIERAACYAPPVYRARSILALGWAARNSGDPAWPAIYAEAMREGKRAEDFYTVIHAHKMLAIRRSIDGDHDRAITDLESLWPMLRLIARHDPATYLDVLNSLAVELLEAGKTDEASRAIQLVTASPLLAFNPEWQQTAQEIAEAQAQPLIIAVPPMKRKPAAQVAGFIVVTACRLHTATTNRASWEFPQIAFLLTCIPNRAAIRAGPRAPPIFIL